MHLYNLTLQKPTGIACSITDTFSSSGSQELVVVRGKLLELLSLDKHGKSGCQRIVPGQYLAVNPEGRALMIAACKKQKLVYMLSRDSAANLTISSPLETHKSCTVTYSIVSVDCGWDNLVFAALELDYSEPHQGKHLRFYELDLGLNNVYRKLSQRVDDGANMLVVVPGGGDGPSGVLVCAENFVIYKNQDPGHPDVCASMFFFLLQTENADVFKVTLDHDNEHVTDLKIKYFDTIPTASAMCVMKSDGFLFAASEFGNYALYQFQAIGTDPDVESSSSTSMETDEGFQPVLFKPKGLKNLFRIDQMESLMPIMGMKVVNLFEEETPQIFTLCGRGPRSSLRILRPGLATSELSVSQLPGVPSAVWTVKKNINDEFDAYIFVSFANETLVLSIGGETVEEEDRSIDEWRTPGKQTIVKVGYNWFQVVIALSGNTVP
ncbi:splicing factor 3B subunit 3-like protein [Tanacetum coccineum]